MEAAKKPGGRPGRLGTLEAIHWAREKEAKAGAGVSLWWTDGS